MHRRASLFRLFFGTFGASALVTFPPRPARAAPVSVLFEAPPAESPGGHGDPAALELVRPGDADFSRRRDASDGASGRRGGLALDARYNLGSLVHLALRGGGTVRLGEISAENSSWRELFSSGALGAYVVGGVGLHF